MKSLVNYIPKGANRYVNKLVKQDDLQIRVVKERQTKHGDFRANKKGCTITINNNLNSYKFLITLIHEFAHYKAFKTYGSKIAPHGLEWKLTYQKLMLPLLNPEVFPKEMLPVLAQHFINPKASTDRDLYLSKLLMQYDEKLNTLTLTDLADGSLFKFKKEIYRKLHIRRTRILTERIRDKRQYVFSPHAEITKYEH